MECRLSRSSSTGGPATGPTTRLNSYCVYKICWPSMTEPTLDQAVRSAVDRLPFAMAESLWCVDVCSCSYDVAAASLGIAPDDVAARVHGARRLIAAEVRGHMSRLGANRHDVGHELGRSGPRLATERQ